MAVKRIKPEAPTTDNRWKMIDVTMRRNGYAGHALIETLHTVQDVFGYIDDPSMRYVAQALNLPLSKVYGVATFYHLFTLKPKGKHTCVICTGTACYIKGAGDLVDRVQQRHHVRPGQTTRTASCRWSARVAWERAVWPRPPCWTAASWRIRRPTSCWTRSRRCWQHES